MNDYVLKCFYIKYDSFGRITYFAQPRIRSALWLLRAHKKQLVKYFSFFFPSNPPRQRRRRIFEFFRVRVLQRQVESQTGNTHVHAVRPVLVSTEIFDVDLTPMSTQGSLQWKLMFERGKHPETGCFLTL